ncbi:MAG: hypothetical protein GX537_01735 [Actinobacteria bacterium]|nr:hypothetical protein [Actinomycetota bacterium]
MTLAMRYATLCTIAAIVGLFCLGRDRLVIWRDADGFNAIVLHLFHVSFVPVAGAVEVNYGKYAPIGLSVWRYADYVSQPWPVYSGSGNQNELQVPYVLVLLPSAVLYSVLCGFAVRSRPWAVAYCWSCHGVPDPKGKCSQCGAVASRGNATMACPKCGRATVVQLSSAELTGADEPSLRAEVRCRRCGQQLSSSVTEVRYTIECGDRPPGRGAWSLGLAIAGLAAAAIIAALVGGVLALIAFGVALAARRAKRRRVSNVVGGLDRIRVGLELSSAAVLGVVVGYGLLIPLLPVGTRITLW